MNYHVMYSVGDTANLKSSAVLYAKQSIARMLTDEVPPDRIIDTTYTVNEQPQDDGTTQYVCEATVLYFKP